MMLRKFALYTLILSFLQGFQPVSAQDLSREVPQNRTQMQLSFAPVAKAVSPAVVNIFASKKTKVREVPLMNNPLFEQFFGGGNLFGDPNFQPLGRTREKVVNSLGSGVIVDPSGLIITNYHVIAPGNEIKIVLSDRRELSAKPVMIDKQTDLALLKLDSKSDEIFPYLAFGEADSLEVGDMVLAIGNPFGVGQTVTSGIVSALARTTVGVADFEFFIQTDASINPGNSGGALVDMQGKLVGINTAIYSKSGTSSGIGFATPSVMAKMVLSSYHSGSKGVVRPWFGAATQNLTQDIAESLGLTAPSGVLVKKLYPGSPAANAGILAGDVIVSAGGQKVDDEASLKFRVASQSPGSTMNMDVLRDGQKLTLPVLLELPKAESSDKAAMTAISPLQGATVITMTPSLAASMEVDAQEGVIVVEVAAGSAAASFVQPGDTIVSINGAKVENVKQLKGLLENARRSWKMTVRSGNQLRTVQVVL